MSKLLAFGGLTGLLFLFAMGVTVGGGGPERSQLHVSYGCIDDAGLAAGPPAYWAAPAGITTQAQADTEGVIVVPTGRTATITSVMGIIVEPMEDDNEHCEFVLEYSNDETDLTTGTELTGTNFHSGDAALNEAANDYCDEGLNTAMHEVGDICTITGLNQAVTGAGWFRWKLDASAADAGAESCADIQTVCLKVEWYEQ